MTKSIKRVARASSTMSRSHFIGTTAAAAAAFAMLPGCGRTVSGRSNFRGVQIGAISYSFRSMPGSAEKILGYLVDAGLSSVELMSDPIEAFAGAPEVPRMPRGAFPGRRPGGAPGERQAPELSEEEIAELQAAREVAVEELRKWRLSPPMERFEVLRKMYNDEGVTIHLAKFSPANWSDEEIDYAFNAARALGAYGVTNEISDEAAMRLGPLAEKHGMFAVLHNHGQPAEPGFTFDTPLSFNPNVALNYDVGHAFGYTGEHPNITIERLHDRIKSLHIKDKTAPDSDPGNTNTPWGQGETPLEDILQLVRREKWPINCDIELEYPIPEGSDAVAEVRKCVEYCRDILT